MINDQLLAYIKHQVSLGTTKETIINNLRSTGWTDADIHEAFAVATPTPAPASVVTSAPVQVVEPAPVTAQSSPVVTSPSSPVTPTQPVVISTTHQPTNFLSRISPKVKEIFFTLLIFAVLCLGIAGVYAYSHGAFISLPNLVSQAIESTKATTAAAYDTTFTIDVSGVSSLSSDLSQVFSGSIAPKKFIVTTSGSYDDSDKSNPVGEMLLSVDGGAMSVEVDFRIVNNSLYLSLTKAPALALLPNFKIEDYLNKWYSIPFKSEDGQLSSSFPSVSGLTAGVTDKLTQEQKDHLFLMVRNAHFIKTVKSFPAETITGEMSYHFAFDLDRTGITSYLQALKDYVRSIGKNDSFMSSFDPTTFSKELDNLKNFSGEIWIGKKDKLLHKLVVNFDLQPEVAKPEQKVNINIVSVFSKWNEAVVVVAPETSTPLQDLIASVVGASLDSAREKGSEAQLKSLMVNMRASNAIFFDDHNLSTLGFCSSADQIAAKKAIQTAGGTEYVCHTNTTDWASSVRLSKTSGYWCVDSTGNSKKETSTLYGTMCK